MAILERAVRPSLNALDNLGDQLSFYARTLGWTYRAVYHFRKEVKRLLAEVTLGGGALAVIGGTVGVVAFLTFFTATEVGLQGYAALQQLGTSNFAALVTSYFNVRVGGPLITALALSATVGAGFTAQLGAMRVSEEIDALEVMGIPSIPFLVTTRLVAAFIAVIPLYVVGILASFLASRLIVTLYFGQSSGTYDHYFFQYLSPTDLLWSFGKALVFAVIVVLVHCYYGYTASGGPAGVGVAVGHAVRTSIVLFTITDFFLSLAIWGSTITVRITG